jgi:hypothetical protein
MVATAQDEATGTGAKVDFSQLAMFEGSADEDAPDDGTARNEGAAL